MSPETAKSQETKTKLLEGALRTLTEQGIAKTSARTIATAAGVNQALVFYHFGSVDELLAAACRYGAEQRVSRHRARLATVTSLSELLAFGREMHEEERDSGYVALLGQLLAGAQTHDSLGPATAAGLDLWIVEIEKVLARVLPATPFGEFADPAGLEQLGVLVAALEDLGPVAQRAIRHHLRRTTRR
jgi:AcrR family transcriptional regulator